ncbi:hypothetical protein C8035_v010140 [Colletotrichum spinosum]|uniref:Uncharacterized protein n=1 Tax=Colletotrichum spinosum TaxID=1347390 RepID=A0A4R8QLM2_9PEZI|nr:hypothetical protein C8035_v010140 [Colletotrichum spinosum]
MDSTRGASSAASPRPTCPSAPLWPSTRVPLRRAKVTVNTLAPALPFPVTIGDIDAALAWLWEPE